MDSDDDCPPDLVSAVDALSNSTSRTAPLAEQEETGGVQQAPGAVPVSIVTGFLGAGKTTLLNYILTQDHGRRIAVIENEVGDSMDIEALIARDGADGSMLEDNLFELKNGCICCTVKDDLVTTLEALLQRRNKFDYVIIETTGLANPGPVASVFWLDDALESALRLDGIVTLVDAKNIGRQLERTSAEDRGIDPSTSESGEDGGQAYQQQQEMAHQNEAAMQLAYADRILVNKTDLVSTKDLEDVMAKIRKINAVAEIRCTERSTVDLSWVLDTKCFSPELALAVDRGLAGERTKGGSSADEREQHNHSHDHGDLGESCADCVAAATDGPGGKACSVHDPAVTTHPVEIPGSLELARLERWLGGLLWDPPPGGTDVYRVKGVVSVEGRDERFVVQGVADLFEVAPAGVAGSAWREGEPRTCKMVFIGRHLSKVELEQGVRSCMV